MKNLEEGTRVSWAWGNGRADGVIQSVFEEKTGRKIEGTEVTRHGSKDDPALYIQQENGSNVLKLASEVEAE